MGKLVKISLEGQLDSGYQVELVEIQEEGQDGGTLAAGIRGSLPSASQVYQDYLAWQQIYNRLDQYNQSDLACAFRGLTKRDKGKLPPEISIESCKRAAEKLKESFNEWLDSSGFRKVEDTLRTKLKEEDGIRLLIKTADCDIWKFPWSVWDFFEDYPTAAVVFSSSEAKGCEKPIHATPRKKVRILAICGEPTGIDSQKERENLKRLRSAGAAPEIKEEPSLQELRDLLWEKPWDIFFFSGHSDSDADLQTGRMKVNAEESITPEEFKTSLKTAIAKGLKIAFLNSCDGLGLARQFVAELQLPLVIAMREPVPNGVAQQFMEYFLVEYAYRQLPLYIAVRKARERIAQDWQEKLPGIDWLPVICQNPAIRPPSWNDLHRPVSIRQVGVASVVCTAAIMVSRFFGLLQPVELAAFDQLMRMRPVEPPDPRILVVAVSERDIEQYGAPLPDRTVEQLLKALERYEPRVIGLDIYRDTPQKQGWNDLIKHLEKSDRVIAVCKKREPHSKNADNIGVKPPPNVPLKRQGFVDVPLDPPVNRDGAIRRQFLKVKYVPEDPCKTAWSLSYRLAEKFLSAQGINPDKTEENDLKFSDTVFKTLNPHTGGFQKLPADGIQILLNYRSSSQDTPVAQQVSLTEVLRGVDPSWVRARVVLIGYTATSEKDLHRTLYPSEMPGVIVQAHMVSQMLSAVLDKRPLLWAWPWWGDTLWVWGWSLVGGLLVWRIHKLWLLGLTGGGAIIPLYLFCFLILWLQGGWMPLIPSVFALLLTTGGCVVVYIISPTWQRM